LFSYHKGSIKLHFFLRRRF